MWLNAEKSNSCVNCSKQDVCKYKDEYIEIKDKIRNVSASSSLVDVSVVCKHFGTITSNFRSSTTLV